MCYEVTSDRITEITEFEGETMDKERKRGGGEGERERVRETDRERERERDTVNQYMWNTSSQAGTRGLSTHHLFSCLWLVARMDTGMAWALA